MKNGTTQNLRILGIALSSRGFGFTIFENGTLINWGIKSAKGDKNAESLKRFEQLVEFYKPNLIAMEDHCAKGSRRSRRIRKLGEQLIKSARARRIKVGLLSRHQLMSYFFSDGAGTKHDLATLLSKRFPEELECRLPDKRRPWESEAYQTSIFDAVGVAVGVQFKKTNGSVIDHDPSASPSSQVNESVL